MNFKKAVLVKDHTKLVYWSVTEGEITALPDGNGRSYWMPGVYIVWQAYKDCIPPCYTDYTEEEFSNLFITEDNAPDFIKHVFDNAPSYEEWCESFN
jgi:hypothetical protein